MNVNGIGAGYPAAGKAKVRQAQDGTQSFDREFMGMASQTPPSFVGKVWTKEELMQSVDKLCFGFLQLSVPAKRGYI